MTEEQNNPWAALAKAARFGYGSAQYNRVLASMTPTDRAQAIKNGRRTKAEFGGHATRWPKESTFPRYRGQTGSVAP